MEDFLVWLLAAYGCSSLLVALLNRLAFRTFVRGNEPLVHYQLLIGNSENILEGVVRRLLFRSFMQGRPIRITFEDCGSTDDTLKIAAVLKRQQAFWTDDAMPDKGNSIMIDLRRSKGQESTQQ